MIDPDLIRHAREFKGYINANQYEMSDAGIAFPRASVIASGEYFVRSPGYEDSVEPNLLPVEGLNHLLMVALSNSAKLNTFYLALFSGNYTPVSTLTAATFAASASELVSNTEGYSEALRQTWTPNAASGGAMDNVGTEAAFTIATASSVTIRGAALLSESIKGGTAGVVVSAAKFAQARTQYNGDTFTLGYRVRITSA